MAKRFTDSRKWSKPFIRGIKTQYKLLWLYILDDCDHAGIWQVDLPVAQLRIGEKLNLDEAIKFLEGKIEVLAGGEKWFIIDFIEFQYGHLDPKNRVHNSAINILNRYELLDENLKIKGALRALNGPIYKDKDKDKDKDNFGKSENLYRQIKNLKLSIEDFEKLVREGWSQSQIDEILDSIENYKGNNKYTSLLITCRNWLRKDHKPNLIQGAMSVNSKQDQEISMKYGNSGNQ